MYAHIMDCVPFVFTDSAKCQFVAHTISSMYAVVLFQYQLVVTILVPVLEQ